MELRASTVQKLLETLELAQKVLGDMESDNPIILSLREACLDTLELMAEDLTRNQNETDSSRL